MGDECQTVESGRGGGERSSEAIAGKISARGPSPDVVGHRIVHGGAEGSATIAVIDEAVMAESRGRAKSLAPLHVPPALAGVRWARERANPDPASGRLPRHRVPCLICPTSPRPTPCREDIRAAGVVRYGFHGLSCASIVRQLGAALPDRLGHRAPRWRLQRDGGPKSGRSIDTTMGLTPTSAAMMMSTRSGDLDPGRVDLPDLREHGHRCRGFRRRGGATHQRPARRIRPESGDMRKSCMK